MYNREYGRKTERQKNTQDKTLMNIPSKDIGTGAELTEQQLRQLKDFALLNGVSPYQGHVVLMFGEPFITISGYIYKITRSGKKFSIHSQPIHEADRLDYGLDTNDVGYVYEIIIGDNERVACGVGIVKGDEIIAIVQGKPYKRRFPVEYDTVPEMAKHISEWQALNRAIPIINELLQSEAGNDNK